MSNERSGLTASQSDFCEEMARLLGPWGMSRSVARVFGYVIAQAQPVTLDQIAVDLDISRTGAWKAAQELEEFGHIVRYKVSGSKLALYGPSADFAAPVVAQIALLAELGGLMSKAANTVAEGEAGKLMAARSRFYANLRKKMREALDMEI